MKELELPRILTVLVVTLGLVTGLVTGMAPGATGTTGPARWADGGQDQAERSTITLMTHDSFSVSKRVLAEFRRETGIRVKVLAGGDAGEVVNTAILTKDEPLADLLFGVDTTFVSRALRAGIFERYRSPALGEVSPAYRAGTRGRVTPVDWGDVCISYDKEWFADRGVPVPATLTDLTDPAYRGRLVVENPATSSPGLAFMLATIAELGEPAWRDFWAELRANDVEVTSGWEQAFNGSFSQGGGNGKRPLVVSYASSPPAAVYFSDPPPDSSPIGTMLGSCFRQVEYIGVLKGTEHPGAARRFVDFALSEAFQADLPLQMFVFPVREGTPLPEVFTEFAEVPDEPLTLGPRVIGRNRERWIDEWTTTVLR